MNLSPRAACQVQALDAGQAAALLDVLERHPSAGNTTVVEVNLDGQGYRCFVGRHRDGSSVLLGLIAGCTTNQASGAAKSRDGPPGSSQRH
jgi:hypothetical protein